MPKSIAQASERALIGAVNDYRAGRLDRAEAACRTLLRRDEGNAAAHRLLAVVKLQQGELGAGRARIERSLALRPAHVASLLIAGRAARAEGDRAAALAACRESGRAGAGCGRARLPSRLPHA